MTEKRFSLEYDDNMFYVKNNSNDEDYYLYWAVELMNELYEENRTLKKQLEIRTASDEYHQRMLNKWLCKNE